MSILERCLNEKAVVYLIGIKGTGVCALAELLLARGARISGSDTAEVFYTDAILRELQIPYYENFDAAHIPADAALVIHSAAYTAETNIEVAEASRRGLPLLSYTEALGAYSACFDAAGITGVHGKTTTTALAGTVAQSVKLPAKILAGSAISSFGGRSTLDIGDRFFIAETCEYRRHFLAFHPRSIVLTSIESDHQDYYPDYASIRDAFIEYINKLPSDGRLIFCADDAGASEAARSQQRERTIPYGFSADGSWRIEYAHTANERTVFKLAQFETEFTLRVPGRHNVLNAAAALALVYSLMFNDHVPRAGDVRAFAENAARGIESFSGGKRRAEIIGEVNNILFMDDYGHHPTAIRATLRGLKEFYPTRRIVVSFMSHTYSRTAALLDEFAQSFIDADMVILHKIYASAREVNSHGIDGRTLYERTKRYHPHVVYVDEPEDAVSCALPEAPALFLTLGAGDNWKLGVKLFHQYKELSCGG